MMAACLDPRADGEYESPYEPHSMEMDAHTTHAWLPAGSTLQRAAAADGAPMLRITTPGLRSDHQEMQHRYEEPSSSDFLVRSETYLTNKIKAPAVLPPLYGLVSMDIFATPNKLENVMTCLKLPTLPPGVREAHVPGLRPWLVLNVQLPSSQPSLFGGATDGPGYSCVFCFALREPVDADEASLMRRFTADEVEKGGARFRDRMKLVPSVANKEQAIRQVMKSSTERTLLNNYNGKPFLLTPQMRCYQGVDHLELDVDVHGYNYLGRKMLCSFYPKFKSMVLDGALIIQGNRQEELPERVVACLRMYRLDFSQAKPFPVKSVAERSSVLLQPLPTTTTST